MAISGFSTSNYLVSTTTPVTAVPLTLFGWVKTADVSASNSILSVADSGANTDFFEIRLNLTTGFAAMASVQAGVAATAVTANAHTSGAWNSLCGVSSSVNSRGIYLNGDIANAGSNATSKTPASIDRIGGGIRALSTVAIPCLGSIAELAIWNAAHSAAEVTVLSLGYAPPNVNLANLVAYYPAITTTYGINNVKGGHNFSITGSLSDAAHCPIMRYSPSTFYLSSPGARQRVILTQRTSPLGIQFLEVAWRTGDAGSIDDWVRPPKMRSPVGRLDRLITQPSTDAAPTDNYDITIEDRWGNDVLNGAGANRDTANVESAWISDFLTTAHFADVASADTIRVRVQNAGANKAGNAILTFLPVA